MSISKFQPLQLILAFIFIASIVFAVNFPRQQDFYPLLISIGLSFSVYFYIISKPKIDLKFWVIIAFITKLILIIAFPNLSDDIYRFSWDGALIKSGISPYGYLPGELINNGIQSIDKMHFDQLNSPNYYSVYPPINQLFFWLANVISGDNIVLYSIITKSMFFIADIFTVLGLIKLLSYYDIDRSKVLIYIMNPLLIIELNGNLHFEGVMISLFIWSLVYLKENKIILSSLLIALSIGVKLIPIFFIPIIIKYMWTRKGLIKYLVSLILFGLLMAIPLLVGVQWENFGKSLDLYFQKFEFNASMYYLIRAMGKLLTGYNQIAVIGPFLGLVSLSTVIYLSLRKQVLSIVDIAKYSLIALSIYYLNTTTVHPWYMSFLVVLSIFVPFRYAIVWSAMIVLSYSHYIGGGYSENYYFIIVEYLVVAYFIWMDWKTSRLKKSESLYSK